MTIRKYNTMYRKTLNNKIKKVVEQRILKNILTVVIEDIGINKISFNKNGVYFNMNLLHDQAIEKIIEIFLIV